MDMGYYAQIHDMLIRCAVRRGRRCVPKWPGPTSFPHVPRLDPALIGAASQGFPRNASCAAD